MKESFLVLKNFKSNICFRKSLSFTLSIIYKFALQVHLSKIVYPILYHQLFFAFNLKIPVYHPISFLTLNLLKIQKELRDQFVSWENSSDFKKLNNNFILITYLNLFDLFKINSNLLLVFKVLALYFKLPKRNLKFKFFCVFNVRDVIFVQRSKLINSNYSKEKAAFDFIWINLYLVIDWLLICVYIIGFDQIKLQKDFSLFNFNYVLSPGQCLINELIKI